MILRSKSFHARRALLSGASLLTLLAASPAAAQLAGPRLGAAAPAGRTSPFRSPTLPPDAQAALQRQNQLKARAATAIDLAKQAQAAARAAATSELTGPIRNGLGLGALNPAVTARTKAADDKSGILTWEGAELPTQVANAAGGYDVTVKQDQKSAILSWNSFNVGRNTSLTFDQKGNKDWIALNRVVDPGIAPSQILGSVKADGTVLVINRNGILFGGASQVNVHGLIATTMDVGPMRAMGDSGLVPTDIAWRNRNFLQNGILGGSDPGTSNLQFSSLPETDTIAAITVAQGASIATSGDGGLILLAAPKLINAGTLAAPQGQVMLAGTNSYLGLSASTGSADTDPNIRGFVVNAAGYGDAYVWNRANALIEADQGNITLQSSKVQNDGALLATTSVSRNGSITISGYSLLGATSLLSIAPDASKQTIPQDASSLAGFKPSSIKLEENLRMASGALLLAPGATVNISASNVIIDSGATISVAGLADVPVPASEGQVFIDPAKKNELRDSPLYRSDFLNGAAIFLDPRFSGVRADGVAWIGSPLIDAKAYYLLAGITADRLMTTGGHIRFGSMTLPDLNVAPDLRDLLVIPSVVIKDGATIDISGGWATYQAGTIQQTKLVTADGRIVPIGSASPDDRYVAVYKGFTLDHPRWGVVEHFADTLRTSASNAPAFIQGRDAGAIEAGGVGIVVDGAIFGQAFAGARQIADARTGSGTSAITGDQRAVQKAGSELPAGGALIISTAGDIDVKTHPVPLPDGLYAPGAGAELVDAVGDSSVVTSNPYQPAGFLPLPEARIRTLSLSSNLLSHSGLSEVSLSTRGNITLEADAEITLNPGGVLNIHAGRRLQIDGDVVVPSGKIVLETSGVVVSPLDPIIPVTPATATLNDYDIVINGHLSVAGRWVNDYNASVDDLQGKAWLNGGTVMMTAASNNVQALDAQGNPVGRGSVGRYILSVQCCYYDPATGFAIVPPENLHKVQSTAVRDISGSILVNPSAYLNLSGGGRVDEKGKLDLTAVGGSLSLKSAAGYYEISDPDPSKAQSSFRIVNIDDDARAKISVNPDRINARITIDPASIAAHGFGGGGTFTLVTPEFALGSGTPAVGTILPLDFFSTAGFRAYDISSLRTELSPNSINDYGGYNALMATQTLTVGPGQTLSLVQSVLPNLLSGAQQTALRALTSGGDINRLLTATVPIDAWDQKPIALTFGGQTELHVAQGGSIVGAAGASLTAGGLLNEGHIRLAGGVITQTRILPLSYAIAATGVRSFSDIFKNADDADDPEGEPAAASSPPALAETHGSFAFPRYYKLGVLDQGQGIVLAPGSVTDLSGGVILNPRATGIAGKPIVTGMIIGGGTLAVQPAEQVGAYADKLYRQAGTIIAQPGAILDLSGVSGAFDVPGPHGYVSTPVWSNGGALIAGAGGSFGGATIKAGGGAPQAGGGTLQILDPLFSQHEPEAPTANLVSADMLARSGFDTLVALGRMTSLGDATITLKRAFLLEIRSNDRFGNVTAQDLAPVVSTGGALAIDAPYIALQSIVDQVGPADSGTPGTGMVTFKADQIDITGTTLFDRSVSNLIFRSSGDIRLTGVIPWEQAFFGSAALAPAPTLGARLPVFGNLSLIAAQIYPTTGSSFAITSSAADGTITIGRSGGAIPAVPYSAGGDLRIQAANIVQGGIVRVPFGALALGGNGVDSTYGRVAAGNYGTTVFAPATKSVTLTDGSITSVSAGGLSIPYGTTTDTIEWYFTPTGDAPLSAPPAKVLALAGDAITLAHGATVDLTGGGDVYAYEFVPGTGGSRDILSQFNADPYSANLIKGVGYQYPDGRQVYAIVPGLSSAPAAAYDPIYSANYANLSSPAGVGKRVYLSKGAGVPAGWYTLLPAQYALLPGGMRVVEQTGGKNVTLAMQSQRPDGSFLVSGYYGDALSGAMESQIRLFSVESQDVIRSYSNIALSSGNQFALAKAAHDGVVPARIGVDAGRLLLSPLGTLTIDAALATAPAAKGRGAQVDISGTNIAIVSSPGDAPAEGLITLVAGNLNNLNAESLLIGGTRTDNADGTTGLTLSASSILVANDAAHPLVAPEIILAVDDGIKGDTAARLTLADGATLTATGTLNDQRDGAYVIDGRVRIIQKIGDLYSTLQSPANSAIGALFRVANGPQRVVDRLRPPAEGINPGSPAGLDAILSIGAINASGVSLGLDTSNALSLAPGVALTAKDIALGAAGIAFTSVDIPSGVVAITPKLQALLSGSEQLTLKARTSIGFDDGAYHFGNTSFDTPALLARQGGKITLDVVRLQLSNSGTAIAAADGTGTLGILADRLILGDGALALVGFGDVSLTAVHGIVSGGGAGTLDAGAANLAAITPYIGDRAVAGVPTAAPTSMAFKTSGTITITNAGTSAPDLAKDPGIPGSSLALSGQDIAIAGTILRATAGKLDIRAAGDIRLSGGAVLEAPGFTRTFGDAADPQTAAALGGTLSLTALGANGIALGDARLSVGGGSGNAGSLMLTAPNGPVDLTIATLDGRPGAGGQGGLFALDTLGAVDLVALNRRIGADGFTGGFNVRTHQGDLVLAAGQILRADAVNLTADGGLVTVGGTIDTSGVNGGEIALYGLRGVTLENGARLDAHAEGYAADDSRRASAGDITSAPISCRAPASFRLTAA
jgi:filamentous hemagglutinin family protein